MVQIFFSNISRSVILFASMKTKFLRIDAMIFALFLFATWAHAQTIQSGIWRAHSTFQINGLSLPDSNDERCVSEAEAKDLKTTLTRELEKNGRVAEQWAVNGQQVAVSIKCKNTGLEAEGKLQGTVTPVSYDLSGTAQGRYQGIPTTAKIHLTGQHLRDCTQ